MSHHILARRATRLDESDGGLDVSLNATRGSLRIGPCFGLRLDDKSRMS